MNELIQSRSHTRTLDKVSTDVSAIILRSNDVFEIINYHEGVAERSSRQARGISSIKVEWMSKTLIVKEGKIVDPDGLQYKKVSNVDDSDSAVILDEIEKIVATLILEIRYTVQAEFKPTVTTA